MKILDTLTGQKWEFTPLNDTVRMYVCGVTPYSPSHVGHAMSYISFDVVRRYLEYRGYPVHHVQNFTDIDDKLIERARRGGTTVEALAEEHIDGYFEDMDALNIQRAHDYPRATQEVPRIVNIIDRLVQTGHAYSANGDVYFRVTRNQSYGKLSHRSLDSMRAGARVEANEHKEHPMDFVLWKGAKPDEPAWESPWGSGRPGWHIECTAMALGYLGETVDIHGGGQDLIFPHHENEIAQSEAYTGQIFARFWMHNGLLQLDQEKMSKSLGNMVTIQDALQRFSADALRMAVLSSHYRTPAVYSDGTVAAAERGIDRLRQGSALHPHVGAPTSSSTSHWSELSRDELDPFPHRERFLAAMDDDFNTPQALGALFDLAHDINRAAEEGREVAQAKQLLLELGRDVLGFTFDKHEAQVPPELGEHIETLVSKRNELRAQRDFAEADRIREELTEMGITLTDSAEGTMWDYHKPNGDGS
jgi:cysteinyl-tRNA synthetase